MYSKHSNQNVMVWIQHQIFYQQIVLHVSVHLNTCTNGIICPDKIIFNISAIIEISQKLSQEGTSQTVFL